ncbi:gliding motility-associated C-terminal domain-containing protein [Flavobacterium sp. CYK-4]|uniref:gliding motility-associated C-terminal domain-containing protein n=1 Tax=Flavobacterium lotistagni TaxID=2709660 RepID=UPI001409D6C5|nr:gliding motility-associated C-terminal domain-containing protein [Flavobacterium lotistagni]NHM08206.1 gliding motility-associated C-terminal domain-containing protein [Flavobacterium lotistagni]
MQYKLRFITFICCWCAWTSLAQDVSLFQQYNGRYDFTFIGNGLNPQENSFMTFAQINTSSNATLNLNSGDVIENAYLYWAGCGPGDSEVKLNGQNITPQRNFTFQRLSGANTYDYFSYFADVTQIVQAQGNGNYTLSELDLNPWIGYYYGNRTNFGGWAIVIIYKNNQLPLNQLNVYDGLQGVPNFISIDLQNLNVIDNRQSKIGFLAWEGDQDIAVGESLTINNNLISNLPLNPPANAFNGTNSFTNSSDLHNMDLDVYDLEPHINIGDTSANIVIRSGQDFVMLNTVVTKLNSQLPDAVIAIDQITTPCNSHSVMVHYTVRNFEATNALQAQVPIAVYVNGVYTAGTFTQNEIPIDGSESGAIALDLPQDIVSPFEIQLVVDQNQNLQSTVVELRENNNTSQQQTSLFTSEPLGTLEDLISCNEGYSVGTFDFSSYENQIKQNPTDQVSYYTSLNDLNIGQNEIADVSNFVAPATPMEIFVKVDNGNCYNTTSFFLRTKKCKPIVYNFISRNSDGVNDVFKIKGLRDVFLNYKLEVYNRWGKLIWTGNNNTAEWDGLAQKGFIVEENQTTDGTYYYSLELNDADYPEPLFGYLYLSE